MRTKPKVGDYMLLPKGVEFWSVKKGMDSYDEDVILQVIEFETGNITLSGEKQPLLTYCHDRILSYHPRKKIERNTFYVISEYHIRLRNLNYIINAI